LRKQQTNFKQRNTQAVIIIEQVQSGLASLRQPNATPKRHHIIAPAMDNFNIKLSRPRTGVWHRVAGQIQRRGH
jgi:hypothetical protein